MQYNLYRQNNIVYMPKIIVPAEQTVVLRGIKSYAGKSDIDVFLKRVGCPVPIFLPNTIPDKEDKGATNLIYLNYASTAEANKALQTLRAVGAKPVIFHPEKYNVVLKSKMVVSRKGTSEALKQSSSSSDSEDDSDDDEFADYLVKILGSKGGIMSAGPAGSLARKKATWQTQINRAGGLKSYITDHDDILEFVSDSGCGSIRIVKSNLKPGDSVKIKSSVENPSLGWGNIFSWSIGVLTKIEGKRCIIDFPEHLSWKGVCDDLEKASSGDPTTMNSGDKDDRFDLFAFVRFEGRKINFTGRKTNITQQSERGFVHAKRQLNQENSYFEVRILAHTDHGIGIGVSGPKFSAGKMPGWFEGSIGFHTDDGNIFLGCDGAGVKFGPTSSAGDTVGCGILFPGKTPTTLFFTRNRVCIGRVPIADSSLIFPIVCSVAPSVVEVVLGSECERFVAQNACTIKSRAGQSKEYHNLAQAVSNSASGDRITVQPCGKHVLMSPLILTKDCEVVGQDEAPRPVILNGMGSHVIRSASSNLILKRLCVESRRGDNKKAISDGAAGICITAGKLVIEDCAVSCEKGSGVGIIEGKGSSAPLSLKLSKCVIGPCGRHGVVLHTCTEGVSLQDVDISNCSMTGIALNQGEPSCSGAYSIFNCRIKECDTGVTMHPSKATFEDMTIHSCRQYGFLADAVVKKELIANFKCCTFTKCTVKAVGSATKLLFDINCGLPASGVIKTRDAQVVIAAGREVSGNQQAVNDDSDIKLKMPTTGRKLVQSGGGGDEKPGKSVDVAVSEDASKGSGDVENMEKDNFGRLCRLLLEVCHSAFLKIFTSCFSVAEKKPWNKSCGVKLLAGVDEFSQRKLGKSAVQRIKEGTCEEWDVTLLTALLLHSPGYLKSDADLASAVEQLRNQRNNLVHGQALRGMAMATEEFCKEWKLACKNLEILLEKFSSFDAEDIRARIRKIETERFSDSQVDQFVEQLQAQIKEIADKAEDALLKAENAATKTEVNRRIVALEELIMKNGQIDLERLPQAVELSNKSRYLVVRRVGAGGMGTVYAALSHDDTPVALKLCEVLGTDRGDREAHILKKLVGLQHPNIVRFLDSSRLNSRLVIVMELVKGESLDGWLERKADEQSEGKWPVTWRDSKDIMLQITCGMSAVHDLQIAHRDLKPANIMFDEVTQHIVIVDFGLSKEQNSNQTVTNAVSVVGTTMYMSPEQLNGITREIDIQTDIWSLGVIYFEILSGNPPFVTVKTPSSESPGSMLKGGRRRNHMLSKADEGKMTNAILEGTVPAIPEVPGPVQDVIGRALMKSKRDRYTNATAMRAALEDAWASSDAASASDAAATTASGQPKAIREWTVEDVADLFRMCRFDGAVAAVVDNSVDGKTLLSLSDEDLVCSVEDGGIGLKKLQVKRLRQELEVAEARAGK